MTEHSKIPVPEDEREAGGSARRSLIERAVGSFDPGSFTPPPVPDKLAPPRKRVPMRRAAQEREPADHEGEQDTAVSPVLHATEPAVVANVPLQGSVVQPPAASAASPVVFSGQRHPVDRERLAEQGMIVPEARVTALLEEFRIVKRQLLAQAADLVRQGAGAAAQRILISSPHPGEGKTYCAVNLALAIAAEKECDVLLVDADFAKPSIPEVLGLPEGAGLMDALRDETLDVADMVIGTDIPGLWVLPAGSSTNSDTEYLGSSRTPEVLDRLTAGAPRRLVIFDSPPTLAASPAAELAKHVAQAVMIVRADRTGQGALEDAVSLLSACPNIQLLLNAVLFSPSGRSFGTYYGYGGSQK